MIDFYPQIKLIHILSVVFSGSLFAVRGLLILRGSSYGNQASLKYLSYAIDTVLLISAVILTVILHQYPFVQSWLTVKVLLLVMYIVLGVFALKRGRTPAVRASCFFAALAVYLFIVSVAYFHDPLGAVRLLTA